jgi:hypothetical protein
MLLVNYYTDKVKEVGDSPQGVDWNSEASQILRFEQLCKILPKDKSEKFSNDRSGYLIYQSNKKVLLK